MSLPGMFGDSEMGDLSPDLMLLLEQVCCGDVSVDDAVVLAARRENADFDRELQAMLGAMQLVDDAGAAERDTLGDQYGQPLVDGPPASIGGQWVRWRSWSALAAVLVGALGVALWQFGWLDGREPRGLHFLNGAIRVELHEDHTFAFDYALPESDWFSIEVTDEATGDVLDEVEKLRAPSWRPDAAERESWPEVVLVTVRAHTRFGDETASGRVRLRK